MLRNRRCFWKITAFNLPPRLLFPPLSVHAGYLSVSISCSALAVPSARISQPSTLILLTFHPVYKFHLSACTLAILVFLLAVQLSRFRPRESPNLPPRLLFPPLSVHAGYLSVSISCSALAVLSARISQPSSLIPSTFRLQP